MKSYLLFFILITFAACINQTTTEPSPRIAPTTSLENMIAIANCSSPYGNYISEVHSTMFGYTFMRHTYDDSPPFIGVVLDSMTGYLLDSTLSITDTMNTKIIEMIKGHEFIWIAEAPTRYIYNIQSMEMGDTNGLAYYIGDDRFGNKVFLNYHISSQKLASFFFQNPLNPAEFIKTHYVSWQDSEIGEIPKEVHIIQNEKDTFKFVYQEVRFNDVNFEELAF